MNGDAAHEGARDHTPSALLRLLVAAVWPAAVVAAYIGLVLLPLLLGLMR
jgi:hypothetical protein